MSNTTPKILIVDDELAFRKVLKKVLEIEFKAEIIEAEDPKQALEYLSNNLPSLILLDMEMPYMNGYETLKIIKKIPEVNKVPVIACSGLSSVELISGLAKMQIADYILKPSDVKTVVSKVKNVLMLFTDFTKE